MLRIVRSHFLYIINALRFNAAQELASLVSAFALGGVFFYMFHDFFSEHLSHVNEYLANQGRRVFTYVIAFLCIVLGGQGTYKIARSFITINTFSRRIGVADKPTRYALVISSTILWIGFSAISLMFLNRFVNGLSTGEWLVLGSVVFIILIIINFFLLHFKESRWDNKGVSHKKLVSRFSFRWHLLVKDSPLFKICFVLFFVFLSMTSWLAFQKTPYFIIYFLVLVGSFFLVIPLLFTLKSELEIAWLERNLGTGHSHILKIYLQLALCLSVLGIYWLVLFTFYQFPADYAREHYMGLKLFLCHCTPLLLVNNFMFQIDARKPFIQLIIVFTLSLFLVSATLVHPLFFFLVPLVKYYGETLQKNRYYRA